jgi:hypothetical protein
MEPPLMHGKESNALMEILDCASGRGIAASEISVEARMPVVSTGVTIAASANIRNQSDECDADRSSCAGANRERAGDVGASEVRRLEREETGAGDRDAVGG